MHTLILSLVLASTSAAPVPLPRAKPAAPTIKDVVGNYTLVYGDVPFAAVLHEGGRFTAIWCEAPWEGTWTFAKGTVHVSEWLAPVGFDPPGAVIRWTYPLRRTKKGKVDRTGTCKPAGSTLPDL